MPVIEIGANGSRTFSVSLNNWLQNAQEKKEWQTIVTYVTQYALSGRTVTVVTMSPMHWSLGSFLPDPILLKVDSVDYLVSQINNCSTVLLAEVVESEDFQRGLLWLATMKANNESEIISLIRSVDIASAKPQAKDHELLLLLDDARTLIWVQPSRDSNAIREDITRIAESFGWDVLDNI